MISPRSAGVVFAIVGTMGIAILAWTDSFWISVLGAGLLVGPLLLLTLSIWRVALANRRATAQRMTSLGNTLNEIKRATRATHASLDEVIRAVRATNRSLDEVVRSGRATNNSMKYVTKAAQTTVNRLNNTAADLRTLRELNRATSDRVGAFAEAILAEVAQVQLDAVEHDSALTRLEAELKRALLRANRDRDRVVGQLHGIIAVVFDLPTRKTVSGFWLMGHRGRLRQTLRGEGHGRPTPRRSLKSVAGCPLFSAPGLLKRWAPMGTYSH